MANVNIIMDGRSLTVPAGTSVLEAARENGIRIPTLCFLKELDPRASCRMCVVEIEGARTFQHACATKVREGMVVHTDTEAVRESRTTVCGSKAPAVTIWIRSSVRCASSATV